MTPATLLKSLDPATAARALRAAGSEPARILPFLKPGNVVMAQVEASLFDGSSKVMVDGQPLRMTLPVQFAVGDTLELVFVAHEPRLTFALARTPLAASVPMVSAAGQFVAALMQQRQGPAMRAPASAPAPLLAQAPSRDGAELAAVLARAVSQSGLFYESHQAEWLAGNRDLAQLSREPQARLAERAAALPGAQHGQDAGVLAPSVAGEPGASHVARRPESVIHPEALPLVQQQLATLESGRIVWQGEIWRGEWLDWEIGEEPRGAEEPDAARGWQTRLRLELPRLGTLAAVVTLGAGGIRIALDASAASAAELRENLASLHDSLAAAGVPPTEVAIGSNEQP